MLDACVVEKEKQELLAKIRIVGERYGWAQGGRPLTVALIKALSSYVCERQIRHLLENANLAKESQRFDPYYRQKSEFATLRILEHIKMSMSTNGLEAAIMTEMPSDIGRYDIVVSQGCSCKVCTSGVERIRIEVKASLGLDLEQIGRYLWDPSLLILVRVITGHVTKIKPLELQSFVLSSLSELNAKADRVLAGKFYTVPGMACTNCLDSSCTCRLRRNKTRKPTSLVTLSENDFAEDLESFFQNLSYVAEKAANMVVEELKGFTPSRNQVYTPPLQGKVG